VAYWTGGTTSHTTLRTWSRADGNARWLLIIDPIDGTRRRRRGSNPAVFLSRCALQA